MLSSHHVGIGAGDRGAEWAEVAQAVQALVAHGSKCLCYFVRMHVRVRMRAFALIDRPRKCYVHHCVWLCLCEVVHVHVDRTRWIDIACT